MIRLTISFHNMLNRSRITSYNVCYTKLLRNNWIGYSPLWNITHLKKTTHQQDSLRSSLTNNECRKCIYVSGHFSVSRYHIFPHASSSKNQTGIYAKLKFRTLKRKHKAEKQRLLPALSKVQILNNQIIFQDTVLVKTLVPKHNEIIHYKIHNNAILVDSGTTLDQLVLVENSEIQITASADNYHHSSSQAQFFRQHVITSYSIHYTKLYESAP